MILVLTHNKFELNGEHFLQTKGTAMGTHMAPSFANLYIAEFKEEFIYI